MHSLTARPLPIRSIVLFAIGALIVWMAAFAAPMSANPPGNNGTVKIDGLPFDSHPDNEPHPGCVFQVDFYGYDVGEFLASVTFEHWNPTGDGQGAVLLHEQNIPIGEDDNSGGGSEAGLDASRTYDLSAQLAGLDPHSQQGFHIKLTVHADGSQGAAVKHKVFWVECLSPGGGEQGDFLLQKVDQNGAGRGGAVFTLTGETNTSFSATATSSATGSAAFSGLVPGTYMLAETTPPTGCTGFTGSVMIVVATDGTVSTSGPLPAGITFSNGILRAVNNCGGSLQGGGGPLNLVKRDNSGALRSGVSFTLVGQGKNLTMLTDAQGRATFSDLQPGGYSLSEIAPAGCTGIGAISVTLNANGTVMVANQPASVTISGNTLSIVNTCGGGGQPGGGGGSTTTTRSGTLAGTLPNTAMPTSEQAPAALVGLLALAGSALIGRTNLVAVTNRR